MANNPIWEICERVAEVQALLDDHLAGGCGGEILERIPVMWKRSLHVGSNWRILAD